MFWLGALVDVEKLVPLLEDYKVAGCGRKNGHWEFPAVGLGQLAVAQLAMADWPQPNWPQGTTGRSRLATTVRERERFFF